MAHACSPSYSGGRDQDGRSLKPASTNSSRDPISKIHKTKRAGGVAQGIGPEFKHQYHTHKKSESGSSPSDPHIHTSTGFIEI
jgi:hypothetical protein